MQVDDIMTRSPRTVGTGTTIGEAWDVLRALEVRHLPVVNDDRELVGILSDRDFASSPAPPFIAELLGNATPSLDAPVSTLMTGAPLTVEPDDDVADAIDLMVENKVGALPVIGREGEVLGIVSYLDILRSLRESAGASPQPPT